jgi:serine protease AprX
MKVKDDLIPTWSSEGNGVRNPDLIGPGQSVVSLRASKSYIDQHFPSSEVGTRFTRGSGTSQATAALSGAAALLLQQRPELTPDQVKKLLTSTATPLPDVPVALQGTGLVNVAKAAATPAPSYTQTWPASSGTGSLEGARGGFHVVDENGTALTGEQDIFGNAWNGTSWSRTIDEGTSWSGGTWLGTSWSGPGWSGTSWSGPAWSGTSWSSPWTGTSWSGPSLGAVWTGTSWSGPSGTDTPWSGTSWSGPSSVWFGTSWSSPFTGTSWSDIVTAWSNSSWG